MEIMGFRVEDSRCGLVASENSEGIVLKPLIAALETLTSF